MKKRTKKRFIRAGLIVFFLLSGLILIFHTPLVKNKIIQIVSKNLINNQGIHLSLGKLKYNLLTLQVVLEGPVVEAGDEGEVPFFKADEIKVRFSPAVFSGKIHLRELSVKNPQVSVRINQEGGTNLPPTETPGREKEILPRPSFLPDIIIEKLEIKGGSLSFINEQIGFSFFLPGFEISAEKSEGINHNLRFSLTKKGLIKAARASFPLNEFGAAGLISSRRLEIDSLRLMTGGMSLEGKGSLGNPLELFLDFELESMIELGTLFSSAGVSSLPSGRVKIKCRFEGPIEPESLNMRAEIEAEGLSFNLLKDGSLETKLSLGKGRIEIPSFIFNSSLVRLKGEAGYSPFDEDEKNFFNLQWESFDPNFLLKAVGQPLRLGSTGRGYIRAGWTGSGKNLLASLRGEAGIYFAQSSPQDELLKGLPFKAQIKADAEAGRIRLLVDEISFPGAVLRGSAGLDREVLSGKIVLNTEDIGLTLARLEPHLPISLREQVEQVNYSGILKAEAEIGGKMSSPRIDLALYLENPVIFDRRLNSIEASISYAGDIIKVKSFYLARDAGRLEGEGRYNLEGKDYRFKLRCISFPFVEEDLPQSLAGFGAFLSFSLEGEGRGSLPDFNLKGSLERITRDEKALGELEFKARTSGEEIEFSFSLPQFSSRGQGIIKSTHPYAFKVSLDVKEPFLNELSATVFPGPESRISGKLKASLEAEAILASLEETFEAGLKLEELELKKDNFLIKTAQLAGFLFSSRGVEVEDLFLSGKGFFLKVNGELPFDKESGRGLSITGNAEPEIFSDLIEGIELKGQVSLDFQLSGLLSRPIIQGNLTVEDAGLSLTAPPVEVKNLNCGLSFSRGILKLEEFSFLLNGSPFSAEGKIPQTVFLPGRPGEESESLDTGEIKISFDNLDPFSLISFSNKDLAGKLWGRLSGEGEVKLKDLDPRNLSASLNLHEFVVETPEASLRNDRPVKLNLRDGILSLFSFLLKNSSQSLEIEGKIDIINKLIEQARLKGEAGLSFLSPFLKDWILTGQTSFQVDVSGPMGSPQVNGVINLSRLGMQRVSPYILLSELEGTIRINEDQKIILEEFKGELNDGRLRFEAEAEAAGLNLNRLDARLSLDEIAWHFPPGFEAKFSSSLSLNSREEQFFIEGSLSLLQAKYSEDFSLQSALIQYLRRPRLRTARGISPLLNKINLNITVNSVDDIFISNNLSRSEIGASLRLVGTAQAPALTGRARIQEGGELYFHGQTFHIEQGTVDFLTETRIEPYLQLQAETRVKTYDIKLSVSGTPETLSASFVSEPPLPEPDIISLLITGRTLEDVSGSLLEVVGYEALSYLDSALTGRLEDIAAGFLGIESVKIDAALIASEENPSARITFEQYLYRNLRLTFSQDLKDAQNRTWILDYTPFRNLNLQGVKRDDNLYILHLRHELLFGGVKEDKLEPSEASDAEKVFFGDIELKGELLFPEDTVRKQLKIRPGKPYRFVKLLEGMERLRRFYRRQGFLEFNLSKESRRTDDRMNLVFKVEPGPVVEVEFVGAPVPGKLLRKSWEIWMNSLSSGWAVEEIRSLLKKHFYRKKYYEVQVGIEEKQEEERMKRIIFSIEPGPAYEDSTVIFSGNEKIPDQRLNRYLKLSGGVEYLLEDSLDFIRKMEELLMSEGYLRCRLKLKDIDLDEKEGLARFVISVDEGLRFTVGEVSIDGNRYLSEDWFRKEWPLEKGSVFKEEALYRAEEKLRKALSREGFHEAKIQILPFYEEEQGRVDLGLKIEEGRRAVIREINFKKPGLTSMKTVLRELEFKEGEILDPAKIQQSRKNLYGLGIFEWVDINLRKISEQPESEAGPEIVTEAPYVVEVNLTELKPVRLRYGLHGNSENLIGVSGEIIHRNLGGRALLAGSSFRLNRDERALRFFFRSPYFLGAKIPTDASVFIERKKRPAFSLDRRGLSLQQQIRLKKPFLLSAVFSLEHEKAILAEAFADLQDEAGRSFGLLNLALTRDTRNNIMDTERGSFLAQNLEYVPPFLGGGTGFFRSFSQYYFFQPLWQDVIYASGMRLGLGQGIGQELPLGRRYFAGGGGTVRGFDRDEVRPQGGDALFILNQEIRFPIYKTVGGVLFLDAGNVYPRVQDFRPLDLRETLGFGLRWKTPYVLLRLDWGFKLDRKPGESASSVFIGIGQAF